MEKTKPYWKPCMCSKAWKNRRIGLLILSLFNLGCTIAISVYIAYIAITEEGFVPAVAVMIILTFGVGQFLFFSFVFVIEGRKYQMNEEGITVLYGGHIQRSYPWTVFQKIVVCDFDHATKFPSNCFLIIRLAAFKESHGPYSKKQKYMLSGIESWRGYHYTIRNFTNILFLEYSPALLDEIVRLSNLQTMFSLTEYGKAKMGSSSMDG